MVVKSVTAMLSAAVAATALVSCSETVTHREQIPFSHGKVELVITSSGGALGNESYTLRFKKGGKTQTFFRGVNFGEFAVAQKGEKLAIHLCRGQIDHAEPIGVGGEDFDVVRLDLDWNCTDKSREA